eukprot:2528266-Karenia_brevis.AAC.1
MLLKARRMVKMRRMTVRHQVLLPMTRGAFIGTNRVRATATEKNHVRPCYHRRQKMMNYKPYLW